ncbi:MAG: HAMP domain-containing protein [Deltaproteobacteria bacterium]|nr:HAMP domain-containing protein [Deltaproteobacteria bacterium]
MAVKSKVGAKLLGVNLLSLLVALVGLLVVIQYLATRMVLNWHRDRVELVARLVLAEYLGKIQLVQQASHLLAASQALGELLAAGDGENLRRAVQSRFPSTGMHILTITDNQGVIQARAHDPGAIGVNISGSPLVRAGLQGKVASRMAQWQDSIALSASAPVLAQDKVVGVVLTGVLIDRKFVELLSRPGAEVAIFFANRLVVNSFKDVPPEALAELVRLKDLAARTTLPQDREQSLELGGNPYTVTFLPLEGEEKPWENLIVVGVSRRELDSTLSTLKMVIVGVGLGSALVGALLSIWLSLGMRRQIAHLADGTRQAAREELAGDIPVTSRDELGELADSFNTMTRALRDKTRLLQAERDRIAANADFLAMIVHDIKAPLTGVRLTIESLEDETLPPDIHCKLKGIIRQSEGLLLHLQNVLDLSRHESGQLSLRPEAVPASFAVQRVIQRFSPLARHRGVTLTAAPLDGLPLLWVDEPSLERILANLLTNALAATPAGGEVRVEGRPAPEAHPPAVELVVADTGPGLPPDVHEHLFAPERPARPRAGGAGLGLHICKTLAEANDGVLRAESVPGRGCRFSFTIPAAAAEPSGERRPSSASAGAR